MNSRSGTHTPALYVQHTRMVAVRNLSLTDLREVKAEDKDSLPPPASVPALTCLPAEFSSGSPKRRSLHGIGKRAACGS